MTDPSILHFVSVSGGKDSAATAILALETQPRETLRFVFADTGNEHESTYEYLGYMAQHLGIKIETLKADFSADMERKRRYIMEKWPAKGVPLADCKRAAAAMTPTGNPYLDLCLMKGRFPATKSAFCTQELKTLPLVEWQMGLIERGECDAHLKKRGIRNVVEWSKTQRGGVLMDFIRINQEPQACESAYGLCE